MKTKIQETYRCDFCNKLYVSKHHCLQHEEKCFHNPVNKRPCYNCQYLEKKNYVIESDYPSFNRSVKLFHCSKKEVFLYPPQCDIRKNVLDLYDENLPMPKTCENYDFNRILQTDK